MAAMSASRDASALAARFDLGDLGGAERHQPVVALGHLGAVPGGGAGLLRRKLE